MSMFLDNTSAHNLEEISQLFANHFSIVYSLNKLADDILESFNTLVPRPPMTTTPALQPLTTSTSTPKSFALQPPIPRGPEK
jgi:hypothetical protein